MITCPKNTKRDLTLPVIKFLPPLFLALGFVMGCGSSASTAVVTPPVVPTTPAWTQLTSLPTAMTTNGAILNIGSDGYLYAEVHAGSPGQISVYRACLLYTSDAADE